MVRYTTGRRWVTSLNGSKLNSGVGGNITVDVSGAWQAHEQAEELQQPSSSGWLW